MADIKSCLFDLDGVIVDTAKYHFLAWRRLCRELGFDLTEEENESLKGISRVESLEILLKLGGVVLTQEEKEKWLVKKNEWYLEYVDAMSPDEILPGVVEFLDLLKDADIKIALGSASKNSMLILKKVNILPYFDAVIDGNKVSKGKPHPQTFTLGAEATGAHPSECVVFEDSQAGIEAGNRGGMFTIGVGDESVLERAHVVIPGFQNQNLNLFNRL